MGCASSSDADDGHSRQVYEVQPASKKQQQQPPNEAAQQPSSQPSSKPPDERRDTTSGKPPLASTAPAADRDDRKPASDRRSSTDAANNAAQPRGSTPVITIPRHQPAGQPPGGGSTAAGPVGERASGCNSARSPASSGAYFPQSQEPSTPGDQATPDTNRAPAGATGGQAQPYGRFVRGPTREPDPHLTGDVWSLKATLGTDLAMDDFIGMTPPNAEL